MPVGISRAFFCRGSRLFRGLVFPVRIFYLCRMTTELCAYSVEACETARRAGVTRVELCASPYEGGTTPSAAAIRMARRIGGLQLSVMVRPRGGDFLYSDTEFRQMLEEVRFARECGADGVVFGLLTPDGRVDTARTAALVAEAGPMQTTFHRAFDMKRNYIRAAPDKFLYVPYRLGYHKVHVSHKVCQSRSEERRVGKECRSRWSPYH